MAGTPIDIYRSPANVFVHEFLGESNKFAVSVKSGIVIADNGFTLGTAQAKDGSATAFVRPHHILLRPSPRGLWKVLRLTSTGAQARISIGFNETMVEAAMTADALLESGLTEGATIDATFTGGTLFDAEGKNPVKLAALKPTLAQVSGLYSA